MTRLLYIPLNQVILNSPRLVSYSNALIYIGGKHNSYFLLEVQVKMPMCLKCIVYNQGKYFKIL